MKFILNQIIINSFLNLFKLCDNNYRLNNNNLIINNCFFSNIYLLNGNGGTIYISSSFFLIINESIFNNSICYSGYGGALFLENVLDCKLSKICGIFCKAIGGQFGKIQTQNNKIILLNYLTISKCFIEYIGELTLILNKGYQEIKNNNLSFNKHTYISGIYYYYPDNMNSNFCTFYNNSVNGYYICIAFDGNTGNLSNSNIIQNNSPTYGVIYLTNSGNYFLNHCIFRNNLNILLFVNSGKLTLNNCLSDQNYLINGNIISNLIITNTQTFFLEHFNSFCFGNTKFLISKYFFSKIIQLKIIFLSLVFLYL